jgi:monoamine oxidase
MHSERSIQDYIEVVNRGISSQFDAGKPKKVIIVGAGLAGLSAGYELKRAGHTPVILEAQQRVGGRVYTLRDPFTEGLYAEVGAMRIPRAHSLTMAYIEKFGLKTNDFTMDNPNAYYYIGGRKMRASEAHADPSLMGFEVSPNEVGKTSGQMYMQALKPLLDMLEKDGDAAWDEIVAKYDQIFHARVPRTKWLVRGHDRDVRSAGEPGIGDEFVLPWNLFREDSGNYYTNMIEIQGGTDRLPHAFLPELKDNIRFGAKMIAMDQSPDECDHPLPDARRSLLRNCRLRHHNHPVPRPAACGSAQAVLARQEPRHPPVALRCFGEDTFPVQTPLLGRR